MPEGDTVYRATRRLNHALRGQIVTRFDMRVPRIATADLRGLVVTSVVARGKHLLMRIGEETLHSHLKMEGEWHLYRPGERWHAPAAAARAIVGVAGVEAVGFSLAEVDLIATVDEDRLVGYLGPDPLSEKWDAAEATRRVRSDPRPVHVALLDQRNVAGFGNVYANEILYLRGVLPHTPANEVNAAALIDLGARTLRANRDRPLRTFTGVARPGRATWVYGRENKSCRRCGTRILSGSLGSEPTRERNVFWCPRCQK